ncbi:MAG: hypothetical protein R2764_01885 [Bacteroidales bacterium]
MILQLRKAGINIKDKQRIAPGVWGMFGGNGQPDEQIDDLDKNLVWDVEGWYGRGIYKVTF